MEGLGVEENQYVQLGCWLRGHSPCLSFPSALPSPGSSDHRIKGFYFPSFQVLTFKEITWQTLRIEADATDNGDQDPVTTPLRLITNQGRIQIALKRRVSVCSPGWGTSASVHIVVGPTSVRSFSSLGYFWKPVSTFIYYIYSWPKHLEVDWYFF